MQASAVLDRIQLQPEAVMMLMALLVGIGTGVGAVGFRYLIQGVEWVAYTWFPALTQQWGLAYVIIMPATGGLLVGLLVYFFAREAKGHGVPEVMEAVALRGGTIRPIVVVVKSLASALSIGSGGSVGREGPIVQIGSALGSALGQAFNMSEDQVRNLVACGAAGGIAATFNAPIAGVIFALEVILGEFTVRYFTSVVVSAVAASVIGRAVFGSAPAFLIPMEYGIKSSWEYAFYVVLGVVAALVGVFYVKLIYRAEDLFDDWKQVPPWVKPAIGGGLLGIVGLVYPYLTGVTWQKMPQIFNVGYSVIEGALANEFSLYMLLVLLVLKLLATSLTLGSGGSGGVFAPSLFVGAMLGAAFELIVNRIFPGIAAPAGAYALVGMGAVFAASAHAPITAVLILFELTGDYRIILPLMLTVVIATFLAQILLKNESIYTLKLIRRGIHLQRGRDVDILQSVPVKDVMKPICDTISVEATLVDLSDAFNHAQHQDIEVLNVDGSLWGLVTVTDLNRAVARELPRRAPVSEIGTPKNNLLTALPTESIGDALTRMGRRGLIRMPVVAPDNPGQLLGMLRQDDIIRAYNLALSRRAELQHRAKRMQLRNIDGTEFFELSLTPQDYAVNRTVIEMGPLMPQKCILISVRRKGQVLIPHGDTTFQAGDKLTAFIRSQDIKLLEKVFK